VSGPKTVRFGSVNGRDQKCDGRDFILVSFHPESKFSKKKTKHFKISEGRPKVLLYIFPCIFHFLFIINKTMLFEIMVCNPF
jgi:hypothetical protein